MYEMLNDIQLLEKLEQLKSHINDHMKLEIDLLFDLMLDIDQLKTQNLLL
jgi:hypothetical protein